MKNLFSLINLVVGVLFGLIGWGVFLSVSNHPQNMGAGIFAVSVAAVCLWLAKESALEGERLVP